MESGTRSDTHCGRRKISFARSACSHATRNDVASHGGSLGAGEVSYSKEREQVCVFDFVNVCDDDYETEHRDPYMSCGTSQRL